MRAKTTIEDQIEIEESIAAACEARGEHERAQQARAKAEEHRQHAEWRTTMARTCKTISDERHHPWRH